jgi:hypothetical protein
MKHMRLGNALAALALGAALILAATPKVHADDGRAKCQSRVEKLNDRYRHEVRAHGRRSEQAEKAKSRLNAEWDRCYTQAHGWYDPNRHEWRTDRDWDRNYNWDNGDDRDRDHDHH